MKPKMKHLNFLDFAHIIYTALAVAWPCLHIFVSQSPKHYTYILLSVQQATNWYSCHTILNAEKNTASISNVQNLCSELTISDCMSLCRSEAFHLSSSLHKN